MPFDHFNLIAGLYDRAGPIQISKLLSELLSLSSDYRLLDVGGGTGRNSAALRSMVKSIFVADPSPGMNHRAAAKGFPTVCAQAELLPYLSGGFERVIMVDAMHHVLDQRKTAYELFRVLVPGGRIVIVEPDIHQFIVKVIAMGEKILLMRSHFLTGDKIASLFTDPEAQTKVFYEGLNVIAVADKVR